MKRWKIGSALAGVAVIGATATAVAQIPSGVPAAQPASGSPVNVLAPGFTEAALAHGTDQLENPSGIITRYGYLNDALPTASGGTGKPTKTEPDGNLYLVTDNPGGPVAGYDYGRRFLYQPHENGNNNKAQSASQAYITRINLDVKDAKHRITLLNYPDGTGFTGLTRADGITYDPFNGQILVAQESSGTAGGVVGTPVSWGGSTTPPALQTYYGSIGRGGTEGIHNDSLGNLYLAEDIGGSSISDPDPSYATIKARQPNSFLYRFVPKTPSDLSQGRLQALQVTVDGTVVSFHGTNGCADGSGKTATDDTFGTEIQKMHTGASYTAQWVTVHDTDVDGTTAFDMNAAAKSHCATPFKRPENWTWVPGTKFASLLFTETGDTSATVGNDPNAAARGAWGSVYRVDFPTVGADSGTIKVVVNGDADHAGFDTITMLDQSTVLAGEDRGDTMHGQLNKLDSLWSFDLGQSLGTINADAKRLVAEGRDPAATFDNANSSQNDGDNEITGAYVSDGGDQISTLQGRKVPDLSKKKWRLFWTQQHGDNVTYEVKPGS